MGFRSFLSERRAETRKDGKFMMKKKEYEVPVLEVLMYDTDEMSAITTSTGLINGGADGVGDDISFGDIY